MKNKLSQMALKAGQAVSAAVSKTADYVQTHKPTEQDLAQAKAMAIKAYGFQCTSIDARTKALAEVVVARWPMVVAIAKPVPEVVGQLTPDACETMAVWATPLTAHVEKSAARSL